MRNVEYTFNRIWGVSRQRNPFRVLGHYMLLTFLLPFAAAFMMGISAALENSYIQEILGPAALLLRSSQFLVLSFSFTLVYFFVPNTKVHMRYALLGGLVAGSLYMLNSWIYIKFQYGLIRYTNFFFAFALFPIFLMYIYFSWLLLLFGALVSFAYQNEKTFALERLADETTVAYKESLAVRTMLELCHRFNKSLEPLQIKEVAECWNVPTRLLQETLDILKDKRMIIATDSLPTSFHLARSADSITVLEVINALRNAGEDPSLLREDHHYKVLYDSLDTADPHILNQSIQALSERLIRISDEPVDIQDS
jgi:membrane protein